MRDLEPKDGAQGAPPLKAKTGGEQEREHRHADGHAAAHPGILGDERITHPANAEPLAELLSQLQHSHGNAYVQRVVSGAGGEKPREQKPAAESQGRGLDAGPRGLMESAFGESFGDVRVHTGPDAAKVNEELGARAVTRGRDIYFNEGEYDPSTREGLELLAHELAHVAQQGRGGGTGGRADTREEVEREADEAARLVAAGGAARVNTAAEQTTNYLQSQPRGAAPTPQGPQGQQQQQQQQPAQSTSANVVATAEMDAAFRHIFYDPAFEDYWASFVVLSEFRRPGFLRQIFSERFPRAMADLRAQRPRNIPEEVFLNRYFEAVWAAVRAEFLNRLRERMRTNPGFQRKVRDMQRPIPPDAMLA